LWGGALRDDPKNGCEGDYMETGHWYTNMAARNQQKHLEFTFLMKALSFRS